MSDPANLPLDSKDGIAWAFEYARAHRLVLYEYHEKIAIKHGVSTEGVMFARELPI